MSDYQTEGERLGQEGMDRVLDNEKEEWKSKMSLILDYLIEHNSGITSDDLRDAAIANEVGPPHHGNCWGALFSGAARTGRIHFSGRYVKSRYARNHASTIRVWNTSPTDADSAISERFLNAVEELLKFDPQETCDLFTNYEEVKAWKLVKTLANKIRPKRAQKEQEA